MLVLSMKNRCSRIPAQDIGRVREHSGSSLEIQGQACVKIGRHPMYMLSTTTAHHASGTSRRPDTLCCEWVSRMMFAWVLLNPCRKISEPPGRVIYRCELSDHSVPVKENQWPQPDEYHSVAWLRASGREHPRP